VAVKRVFQRTANEQLSLYAQIVFLALAFLIGIKSKSKHAAWLGIPLGIVMDGICQFGIAGEGPGALVGLFVFPIYCILLILLGRKVHHWRQPRIRPWPVAHFMDLNPDHLTPLIADLFRPPIPSAIPPSLAPPGSARPQTGRLDFTIWYD